MDRERLFDDFKSQCRQKEICGQGNPNADILIIGKEPYGDEIKDTEKFLEFLETNYNNCGVHCFQKNKDDNFGKLVTWKNYQKLIYYVYKGIKYDGFDKDIIDFEKHAFTTELSSMPRRKSNYKASKKMIQKRLAFFKESGFIQSFPVVVLACGPYIKNIGDIKNRQIDSTFSVTYKDRQAFPGSGIWFYNHYNKDNSKLVIHTRQLSNFHGDGNLLIKKMAEVIRKHLNIE
jgi:hypothetical protein